MACYRAVLESLLDTSPELKSLYCLTNDMLLGGVGVLARHIASTEPSLYCLTNGMLLGSVGVLARHNA